MKKYFFRYLLLTFSITLASQTMASIRVSMDLLELSAWWDRSSGTGTTLSTSPAGRISFVYDETATTMNPYDPRSLMYDLNWQNTISEVDLTLGIFNLDMWGSPTTPAQPLSIFNNLSPVSSNIRMWGDTGGPSHSARADSFSNVTGTFEGLTPDGFRYYGGDNYYYPVDIYGNDFDMSSGPFRFDDLRYWTNQGFIDPSLTLDFLTSDGSLQSMSFGLTSFSVQVVPLPAAFWLFSFGLLPMIAFLRRKQS